ncbi:MAG: patatin-like phospholipase family protein [Bacteroidales bacterium]|nr:patatin-like phospholipase family protein [Bacteroidales bacterium]
MRKIFIVLWVILICAPAAFAQDEFAAGFGLDPSDKAALKAINARMDSIRAHRPTVALVLSGGGAKGAAQIGTMKMVEELGIPVDMVVGTSVGGLLGGLYAIGYSPDYLDSLIRSIDWDKALYDRLDRRHIPLQRLKYKEKYVLSFPFYYSNKDMVDTGDGSMDGDGQLHLSASKGTSFVRENLMRSLPSGFAPGQNVNSIISSKTVGVSDSTDFFKFSIPYACVATDLVSGRAKIWHSGDINTAMRSTMSIPGLFKPIRTGGMVLVDGGMRNNFPADLAVAMGADLIIGVDLSQAVKDYDQVHNILDVINQGIDMLGNDSFRRNLRIIDLKVKPSLPEYDMLSFNAEAIDTMINRGMAAAEARREEFEIIKEWVGSDTLTRQAPPAIDVNITPVLLGDIEVKGVNEREKEYILSRMKIHPGQWVTRNELEDVVFNLYGTNAFDYVNYELRGTKEPFTLVLLCKRAPVNMLGVGARMDTEELVSVLLNLGINTNAIQGSALDFTAKIGANPYARFHFTHDTPRAPTFNVDAAFRWVDRNSLNLGENRYNIAFLDLVQEAYMSNINLYNTDFRFGIRNRYFNVRHILADQVKGDYDVSRGGSDFLSLFAESGVETFDNSYFPSAGYSFSVMADVSTEPSDVSRSPFGSVSLHGKMAIPAGNVFALLPSFNTRFIFGDNIPVPFANVVGGVMDGRYIDQQVAFIGLNNAAYMRNYLMLMRLDFRWKFLKNNYITATANYLRDFDDFRSFSAGGDVLGFGVEYAYNSIVGPLKANFHWNSLTKRPGFYLSLGFDF